MRCGVCGGGFSKISAAHFGCSTSRNKGAAACTNVLTVRRDRLETTVLDGLRDRLMEPSIYESFAAEFTAGWNKQQASASGDLHARKAEHGRVKAQLEKLVDALVSGTPIDAIKDRMRTLEDRRIALEDELENAVAPAPYLHPTLAVIYRERIAALAHALTGQTATPSAEFIRGLVEEIRLVLESGARRIELRGELAAIFGLAGVGANKSGQRDSADAAALSVQMKLVAGTGFEPVTFRL